jgi:cysteine desulfurase
MIPYFTEKFGNSGSRSHSFGWEAEDAVENARRQLALSIGAQSKSVIFTSGATEANNIAIKGAAEYLRINRNRRHVITVSTEHKCVIESCKYLESHGFSVTYLPVRSDGLVDMDLLVQAIRAETALISIAWVHNEIGVIQPIAAIGRICKDRGILLHTDAAQAFGRVAINMEEVDVDLMSLSGHKVYGPKGIGALYIRPGTRLSKFISGGGQEKGLRSGTLPVPLCVGFGEAAQIANELRVSEWERATEMQRYIYNEIMQLEDVH